MVSINMIKFLFISLVWYHFIDDELINNIDPISRK